MIKAINAYRGKSKNWWGERIIGKNVSLKNQMLGALKPYK